MPETQNPPVDVQMTRIRRFISRHRWTFAKSMPRCPHDYTLRRDAERDSEFVNFVEFIRSYGYDMVWGRYNHRYLDVDGQRYWTMGYLTETTTLINRAKNTRPDNNPGLNSVEFVPKYWPTRWDQQ